MGNTASTPTPPPAPVDTEKAKLAGIIIGSILGLVVIISIVLVFFRYRDDYADAATALKGAIFGAASAAGAATTGAARSASIASPTFLNNLPWGTIIPVFLGVMSIVYFSFGANYALSKGKYRATPPSYNPLIVIKQNAISTALGTATGSATSGPSNGTSITRELTKSPKTLPLSLLSTSTLGLVNWRPLTVRLPGYLGGDTSADDGVFS
jgi:hypothetical protein